MAISQDQHQQPVRGNEPADLFGAQIQLAADVESLSKEHRLFADLFDRNGLPPLWRREVSFSTLVRFILEQQVSLASANAAFRRIDTRLGGLTSEGVLGSTDAQMKADGFSRQKTSYVRGISEQILSGELQVAELTGDPGIVEQRLLDIRGIGPWTASCFLLFVVGERDVWPTGDRALYVSMKRNLALEGVPGRDAGDAIAEAWIPYRSTAAKMLWHDYLGGRSHEPNTDAGFIEGTGKVPL